jgi:negative regulator of flagellin synthesis FlgM
MQHFDSVDDRGGRGTGAARMVKRPLHQRGAEPFATHARIEVGGKLECLRPPVSGPPTLVGSGVKTEGIGNHANPGRESGRKDLAKRSGASPVGGRPITIRAASAALKLDPNGEGSFDAAKVERIAQAIRDGQLKINAGAIADKLISNAQELLDRTGR